MKEILIAGALAMGLLAEQTGQQQVAVTSLPEAPGAQQQQIPDSPRPQTQGLGPVAPGKGSSGILTPSITPADPNAPPTSLPASPGPTAADSDVGPTPDLPATGQGPAYVLKVRTNFVDVPFTVKDSKNRLVPGLHWQDIRVYENGVRQRTAVFTVDPFPLSVALVIDQSLPFDTMARVNNALGALGDAFTPYDSVAVFTYNHGVKQQDDFDAGQSARLSAVVERAKVTGSDAMYYAPGEALEGGININGGAQSHITPLGQGLGHTNGITPQVQREVHTLNDAILEAAKSTTKAGRDRRRVVYVISDGKEYGSKAKSKEVIRYLQANKIAVYATLVGDSAVEGLGFLDHVHLPLTVRDNILPVYTAATGGETYAEFRTKGIETSFQRIATEVRTQYTIGYYSNEPSLDEKFRSIEVRVMRPNLNVIAKKGYYPSAEAVQAAPAVQRPLTNNQ